MNQKLKIKSKSPVFRKFIEDVDSVLSKQQIRTPDGNELQSEDNHFKEQVERLARIKIVFDNGFTGYPINEWVAKDLIYSEIKELQDEEDIEEANFDRRQNV